MRYTILGLLFMATASSLAQSSQQSISIVELFTSQGCSSCPSADKLLKEAVNSNSADGEVYGLSFHVSYWNRLGWKDPYSSEQFTERQKWYAKKMRLSRIYTPQMIVDGQDEFVGSQKPKLIASLKTSFSANKKSAISITNLRKTEDRLTISYTGQNISSGEVLNLAIVQRIASNHVPRGENRHKTLVHSNVVRAFRSIPAQKSGEVALDLPELNTESSYEVIAYVQNLNTLKISAVGKATL
ncbi:MAG: DUF1223 domain-containing protein [Reichenbachiella sp.]|uniref:DUF1223 domain-containing protein n=1 Tax=Reichenbachiella sp. TaxID=2184521 RepID=UPI0032647398